MDKLKVLLVGVGGYGNIYVNALLNDPKRDDWQLEGIVDPYYMGCRYIDKLKELNIPIYNTMDEFYLEHSADLAVISTPIVLHSQQTCIALKNGSHVLCEKPVAPLPSDVEAMRNGRDEAGKVVSIGYQWSHATAMLALKEDIMAGIFGKAISMRTIILWPRDLAYYARGGGWAGKEKDANGNYILDSVAMNATAHYLHNMLWLLGSDMISTCDIAEICAETYRVNRIDMYDTATVRMMTPDGVKLHYVASHAIGKGNDYNPEFEYVFENAKVTYSTMKEGGSIITAHFNDGTIKEYGDPFIQDARKLWHMMEVIRGENQPVCTIETATMHLKCIHAIQKSVPKAVQFTGEYDAFDEEAQIRFVPGLRDVLLSCYDKFAMPSELGAPWAVSGQIIHHI